MRNPFDYVLHLGREDITVKMLLRVAIGLEQQHFVFDNGVDAVRSTNYLLVFAMSSFLMLSNVVVVLLATTRDSV